MLSPAINQYIGYGPPWFGGQGQVLSPQVGLRLIKNDLRQLYLTRKGQRLYRPDFGTSLSALPFEDFDEQRLVLLRGEIITVTQQYEPRVTLTNVSVTGDSAAHQVTVQVVGNLTFNPTILFDLEVNAGTFA